jgi:RNase P subunit RPR2
VLQCTVGLKKNVNEKSRAKTNNSTDNVMVICDKCQDDNGKMGNDYKQEEEIKRGMLENTKTE